MRLALAAVLTLIFSAVGAGAAPRPLSLRHVAIDLPAAPAAIVAADLDGDGRKDLLIVVAYTDWGSIGSDRIEGLLQVAEVVPAVFDRREARAWVALEDGSYRAAGGPLELPVSVLAVQAGPRDLPVVALTDEGIERIRLVRDERGEHLVLEPVIADPPVLAGSGVLLGGLEVVRDVDGDGLQDVLLPARDGIAVYRGEGSGLAARAAARISMPGDKRFCGRIGFRSYPLPEVIDLDGDRVPDLLVHSGGKPPRIFILKGLGNGSFGPPNAVGLGCLGLGQREPGAKNEDDAPVRELAFFGDLEGDGRIEAVTTAQINSGKGEIKQGKEPHFEYRFHRVGKDHRVEPSPYQEIEVVGHAAGELLTESGGGAFRDLDGDGRKDLVTVTLDFSLFQVVRIFTTKKISVGFAFHVRAQGADGRFREVDRQVLDDRLTIDLNNVQLDRLSEIAGDLDGDGKLDFVRLGAGRKVTIRRGGAGCRFSSQPDLEIELDDELADASQVRIRDLDGDGRDDLSIVRPLPAPESGVSPPVRLDLYLSGGAR